MSVLKIAAVYIRVSTDDQTELSPDSQLEALRAWAEKRVASLQWNTLQYSTVQYVTLN